MCAVTTWPFLSFTRNVVLGRVSTTSPSIWIASSLDMGARILPGKAAPVQWRTGQASRSSRCVLAPVSRGRRNVLPQQCLELGAREEAAAETLEMARRELAVDHDDPFGPAQLDEPGECDFRGVPRAAEHRLAKEHP